MKYIAILPVSLLMVSSAAFSQVPKGGVPQIDPLAATVFLLFPFVMIFIMAVVLLFTARWIFKARHKENMAVLQQIEQHLALVANAPLNADTSLEVSEVSLTESADAKEDQDASANTQA